MIYADDSKIEVSIANDQMIIRERDTWTALFRVVGLIPLAAGGLVLYVFASGGGPKPVGSPLQQAFGLLVLFVMACALGVAPLWLGLDILLFRRGFTINAEGRCIQSHLLLGQWSIWKRNYPTSLYEGVRITYCRLGGIGVRWRFVISCTGRSSELDLAVFSSRSDADDFASKVSAYLGMSVEYVSPECKPNAA